MDDDEPGVPDDGDKPEKRKSPILGGQLAGGIELFLLVLTVIEKLAGLTDHFLS
ncbi:hypothetical protein GCM10027258_92660 [Amycolatopsis stemonae]